MKRGKRSLYRKVRTLLLAGGIMVFSLLILSGFTKAQPQKLDATRYYTIVTVHANDTLWDIAQRYHTEDMAPVRTYLREIMQVNNLSSSRIYIGQKLAVPYIPDPATEI